MFSHQMKLISLHPVGPTASFDLSLLHTHQLISLPGDSRLHVQCKKGNHEFNNVGPILFLDCIFKYTHALNEAPAHSATTLEQLFRNNLRRNESGTNPNPNPNP